jgi:hypothetical protein
LNLPFEKLNLHLQVFDSLFQIHALVSCCRLTACAVKVVLLLFAGLLDG